MKTPSEQRQPRDAGASIVEYIIVVAAIVGVGAAIIGTILTTMQNRATAINLNQGPAVVDLLPSSADSAAL